MFKSFKTYLLINIPTSSPLEERSKLKIKRVLQQVYLVGKFLSLYGWDIKITKVMHDIKITRLHLYSMGCNRFSNQAGVKSGINYKINGIFQEPSGYF